MTLLDNAALTLALALVAGLVAQSVAAHLGLPGLVLLLATGVVLGPDVANVVRPDLLGASLHTLVGFAVAVILFEGGLGLDLKRLRREQRAIRQLVTLGALVTALGGTLSARLVLGWTWRLSALFGTLIIVTGPTVVTPLLRRLKVNRTVTTILEAEGVLIDAIGAIIAAIALPVALLLRPGGWQVAEGLVEVAFTLSVGIVFGVVGGLVIAVSRMRKLVPDGMENVFTLGLVLLLFQLSNVIVQESGVAAVILAGIVVRNVGTPLGEELRQFKQELTVMLIGLLFVLLAADVRVADVIGLGLGGLLAVVIVIAIVRPLNVIVGTWGTTLGWRERVFLAWIAPRGIIAAAVASLFVIELDRAGIEGGRSLRAIVFLVIAATALWSGLTGGVAARVLRLRRPDADDEEV
jgi:NhaP-type Na+/H+ or K+/H+ antiporter